MINLFATLSLNRYHNPKCSESIGMIFDLSINAPATTRDSLFASANRLSNLNTSRVGASPA